MKLIKSKCEKVWLFDAQKDDLFIRAGLACFLSQCPSYVTFNIEGEEIDIFVPFKAINSGIPMRITNARLSML